MQSSTGQYSTQAGEPAQPVQHSVITANSFGFFFRGVKSPLDLGSNLSSSGTNPAGFASAASADMRPSIPYAFGIFIYGGGEIAGARRPNGRFILADQRSFLWILYAPCCWSFLIYWVPKMATQGWGCHCWWGLPGI